MNIMKLRCQKDIYHQEKTAKLQIIICRADDKYPVHYMVDTVGNVFSQVPENYWIERTSPNDQVRLFVGLQSKGALLQSGMYFFPVEKKDSKFQPVKIKGLKLRNTETITKEGFIAVKNCYEFCPSTNFRGFQYFEMYSDRQLNALGELLSELTRKHNIPSYYKGDCFWSVNDSAKDYDRGIYGETALSEDVVYPYPEKRIVDVLKTIK